MLNLGPDGGARGDEIVAQGTPEQVAKVKGSFTGGYFGAVVDALTLPPRVSRRKPGPKARLRKPRARRPLSKTTSMTDTPIRESPRRRGPQAAISRPVIPTRAGPKVRWHEPACRR